MARKTKCDVEQVLPSGHRGNLKIDVDSTVRFYEEVIRRRVVYRQYSLAIWPLTDSLARKVILLTRQHCESQTIQPRVAATSSIQTTRFRRLNTFPISILRDFHVAT